MPICVAFSEKLNFHKNYIEILDDSVSDCPTPARVFLVSNCLEENPWLERNYIWTIWHFFAPRFWIFCQYKIRQIVAGGRIPIDDLWGCDQTPKEFPFIVIKPLVKKENPCGEVAPFFNKGLMCLAFFAHFFLARPSGLLKWFAKFFTIALYCYCVEITAGNWRRKCERTPGKINARPQKFANAAGTRARAVAARRLREIILRKHLHWRRKDKG